MSGTLLEYKCPYCGGGMTFDIGTQQMKCPYCESLIDVSELREKEEAAEEKEKTESGQTWSGSAGGEWDGSEAAGMATYSCRSCGASIIAEETTASSACPYCGNPITMVGQVTGDLKPDIIIPFKLDKNMAKQAFAKHLMHKPLLPKAFKNQHNIEEIKGIYVPFWLFSADADGSVRYDATRVRTWSDSKYNYTETSYFDVYRAGSIAFDNIPVDGSEKMPDDLMESIEPFDLNAAAEFQSAYMAGYAADRYDVDEAASIPRAEARMRQSVSDAFASTVRGFNTVSPKSTDVRLFNGLTRYAMYPVWLLNTTWNGKKYTFAMNGQTGKFAGDLPLNKGAYVMWLLLVTAGVAVLAELAAWLIGFM